MTQTQLEIVVLKHLQNTKCKITWDPKHEPAPEISRTTHEIKLSFAELNKIKGLKVGLGQEMLTVSITISLNVFEL